MSAADKLWIQNCQTILRDGTWDSDAEVRPRWADGAPAHTIRLFGLVNRYDLTQEFPLVTFRQPYLRTCVDELLWIWQKKSNQIQDLVTHVWDAWADEFGSIGKAYGYQLAQKHRYPEGEFDQVDRVLYELQHHPASRRILTNMYVHADLHEMGLAPCAHSMTFHVADRRLSAVLHQRSQDMLTANHWNVTQYAVLLHCFAQVSGLLVGELLHVIADAHIYDRHVPLVEQLFSAKQHPAPKFSLDKQISDFYQFSPDSVQLADYFWEKLHFKIPVAQ